MNGKHLRNEHNRDAPLKLGKHENPGTVGWRIRSMIAKEQGYCPQHECIFCHKQWESK